MIRFFGLGAPLRRSTDRVSPPRPKRFWSINVFLNRTGWASWSISCICTEPPSFPAFCLQDHRSVVFFGGREPSQDTTCITNLLFLLRPVAHTAIGFFVFGYLLPSRGNVASVWALIILPSAAKCLGCCVCCIHLLKKDFPFFGECRNIWLSFWRWQWEERKEHGVLEAVMIHYLCCCGGLRCSGATSSSFFSTELLWHFPPCQSSFLPGSSRFVCTVSVVLCLGLSLSPVPLNRRGDENVKLLSRSGGC